MFARCTAQRGAGREVVGQLLASPTWGKVTTVGRRAVDVPAQYTGWEPSKLKQVLHCSSRLWGVVGSFRGMAGTTVALGLPSATHYTCTCASWHMLLRLPLNSSPPVPPSLFKLHQVVVDMDKLEEEGKEAFEGADSVFCALGTTRAVSRAVQGGGLGGPGVVRQRLGACRGCAHG